MKVSCTNAARMMLVLLFAFMAWGMPEARAQDDCCNSILDLQITRASSDECCFTVSGKINVDTQCFLSWRVEELVGGSWVSVSPSLLFNSDGSFSYTICGQYGTHTIRVLFVGYNGKVLCSKRMEYTCEQTTDCCNYIYGPYVENFYNENGRCCYKIYGSVGEIGLEACFKYWELQVLTDAGWVTEGTFGFNPDGSYAIEKCVETGTYQFRILFYGYDGSLLCIKDFTLTCQSNCCEYIQGPYIYPESTDGECCFTIKGSVGERGLECFGWWEFEYLDNGSWVNDGVSYAFDPDGTFSIYKCFPYGTHQMRILFYDHNGNVICVKELVHDCPAPCCDFIKGPYITPVASDAGKCCFKLWGGVGQQGLQCFGWWEFEYLVNGAWVNDGVQYPFDVNGNYGILKCLPPGNHVIRILFYGHDGTVLCEKKLEYNCEVDCCETIDGPYIGPAPFEPHPGYCCFTISGKVGQDNPCFKFLQLEILQNGVWTNVGGTWYFNGDGSFSITHCVPVGSYQIRVLFYSPNGEVICVRELSYTCEQRCCETIQGPYIYPATIEPAPGRCCFTISGTVGPQNPCFKYWEYEQLINGVWVNDMVQYPFAADGSFSITKCVTPGTYQIRILFRDSHGNIICTKYLDYVCDSDCCETIQGPYIGPASIDPPPGRCCFTISGTIGKDNQCFVGWQYEELINGVWVNDLVTYPFNPDGSFSITKCRPYGTHYIRIYFIGPNGDVICGRKLKYTCEGDCCETINGPFVYPATDGTDGRCCFTVKGSVGEDNPCFKYWQYEELINGVWVNDLVDYPFNSDGSFSITKCRPYGTHQIRILFYDSNGNVICRRELTYSCESDCCNSIDGPYIFPALNPTSDQCCFTVKGSVGECNPCFKYWEYEELINGVWVNDMVSYLFNADGSFSITKCRPYGTHNVRILFYDYSGHVICVRELTYTCKPTDCCETIQGPFIQTTMTYPDKCCFLITGTVGPDNPCFRSFEIERYDNGVWINDMVSYIFQPDGSFSIPKCVPSGSYLFRILFRDFNGRVICVREFKYECANTCCETIQGPFIQTTYTSPTKCCFRIYGSVGPNNPCFRSYEFERFVNGVWVNDLVSYIFQPNGDFVLNKCVPPGTHLMRILFRDQNGRVICVKEFEYHCDYYDCCETIQGPVVTPIPSPSASECCFKITGSIGQGNPCFQSVELEVLLNGVWVNDMVSYIFQPDGSFTITKCLPAGSYTMRLLFRDFNGAIICVKEFTASCDHHCCETISGPYIAPDPSVPNRCCFKIYGKASRECFQSVEFEVLLNGVWVNDLVSYIIYPDGTFSIYKCLPIGTIYTMRLLFRDYSGKVICIRDFTYGCRGAADSDNPDALKASTRPVSGGVVQNLMSMPNPASDQMTISYELTEESAVRLSLFSHIGQEVLLLDQGVKTAGKQTLPISISNLASGVYFVRAVVNGTAVDLPVTIVK